MGSATALFPQTPAPGLTLTKSQHLRLTLPSDIQRVAVGDPDIVAAEPIGTRELLLLGKGWGRTTLIVWFNSGAVEERHIQVRRDLSTLEEALRDIHPAIRVEMAPDRDAIVLLGTVPEATHSQAAETAARNYLSAVSGVAQRGSGTRGQQQLQPLVVNQDAAPTAAAAAEAVRIAATAPLAPTGSVINLLRVEKLPELLEERIERAVRTVAGDSVRVRRMQRTQFRDDTKDVFVMDGRTGTQVGLTRAISLAAQLIIGRTSGEDEIRVVADESGALVPRNLNLNASQFGGGGGLGGLFGGGGGGGSNQLGRLSNLVGRNIGRAKAIEAAEGRLISFIEVRDLPQIRIGIRLYEVNRTKLKNYNPNTAFLTSEFQQPSLNPALAAGGVQGGQAPRVGGAGRTTVQNVLAFLGGTLSNQMQFASPHFAVDQVFTLLERAGIAKSLSSPSLTVLSGEQATFQVGGEIPIPEAFAPIFGTAAQGAGAGGGIAPGVFSFVVFRPFGIQLGIRPLIGDDDKVTLDVTPQIITPSTELTNQIRESTGTNPLTTAFQARSLRTSARLDDGQTLIVGGLLTRSTQERQAGTPGLKDTPGLGWLFKSFERSDEGLELVLVVNPAILRDPVPDVPLWQFAERDELLSEVTRLVTKPAAASLDPLPSTPSKEK